jgi:hypothetical protein
MDITKLIEQYLAGPQLLREAVTGMTPEELDSRPVPGKWSTREVVCHIADFEPVYGDRMKRVIVEDQPTLFGGDPDAFAGRLAYAQRDIEEELSIIDMTRRQMARILRTLTPGDFERTGKHSVAGPLTLKTLLERITGHIPHHLRFIEEKKSAMRNELDL